MLKRLSRRLALGLFLDRWPSWAAVSLLLSGVVALICRLFFPGASLYLSWLWLTPLVAALPVLVVCQLKAYRPADVVAMADWLGGGQGTLLTMLDTGDTAWASSSSVEQASRFSLPRLRPWSKLAVVAPAAAFLAVAWFLPQRAPRAGMLPALADEIAADLKATVSALSQEKLITPAEEQRLEEEIERIREKTKERVAASSWEAADTLREELTAGLSAKQDAVKWAEASLSRLTGALQAGDGAGAAAHMAELTKALEKLAESGLTANLPADLQRLLKGGKFGTGTELQKLAAAIGEALSDANARLAGAATTARFGRFNPADFPTDGTSPDGDGEPGRGGVNRGRADASLTWGKESQRVDRFKATPLPPGAARTPDDWAPIVVLPGTPQEAARLSTASAARQYEAAAGQAAWRRSLAPRHQSAVKKYFDK